MWQKNVRYLDFNASAGISERVRKRLIESLCEESAWLANPSSRHRPGQNQARILNRAAETIARSLGSAVSAEELLFVSSGTEANQSVLRSFARSGLGIVIGAGEHSASSELIPVLKREFPSLSVLVLPLLSDGAYDWDALPKILDQIAKAGAPGAGLSLFWANHETGVIADFSRLSGMVRQAPIPVRVHLDGAQAWGKIPMDVLASPAHFVTVSSHKIGAPAGTGIIWMRERGSLHPLIPGSQGGGLRGGTENALGILATSFAAEEIDPVRFASRTSVLRDRLEQGLRERFPEVAIFGAARPRVPNTSRFGFRGFPAYGNWVELLDLRGFAVSHGSACRSQVIEPSPVLLGMGVEKSLALNSIRVSFGGEQAPEDVDDLLEALAAILASKKAAK